MSSEQTVFNFQATGAYLDLDVIAKDRAQADSMMRRLFVHMLSTAMSPEEIAAEFPGIKLRFVCMFKREYRCGGEEPLAEAITRGAVANPLAGTALQHANQREMLTRVAKLAEVGCLSRNDYAALDEFKALIAKL